MIEIGSEFWAVKPDQSKGIYDYLPQCFHTKMTLCGRTALDIIIEEIAQDGKKHRVYMPSYCCHTMIEPFYIHDIEVIFYDVICGNNGIEPKYMNNNCDIVFLIDYFGFINNSTIEFARIEKKKGKIIIYDMTHSLFCDFDKESHFDYVFGSFKKWMGVNAGFVSKKEEWVSSVELKKNEQFVNARNKAFDLKRDYIDNSNKADKNEFLGLFAEAENMLAKDYKYYKPDSRSIELLASLDTKELIKKRFENAKTLISRLKEVKGLRLIFGEVKNNECPLFVPISIENNRDALRDYLIGQDIYMPIHWPVSNLHSLNDSSRGIYMTEVSCVCDQRYTIYDMKRIVATIKQFWRKEDAYSF